MKSPGVLGFVKRSLPFVAALMVGVFITSLFIDIKAPSFRGSRHRKHHEMKRLRVENEQLREENLRLRNEMENTRWEGVHHGHEAWPHLSEMPEVAPPPMPPTPFVPGAPRPAK